MIEYLKILDAVHGVSIGNDKHIEFIKNKFNITLTKENYPKDNKDAINQIVRVIGTYIYNDIMNYQTTDKNLTTEYTMVTYLVEDKVGNYRTTFYGGAETSLSKQYLNSSEPSTEEEWLKQFMYEDKEITDLFSIINDSEKLLKNG